MQQNGHDQNLRPAWVDHRARPQGTVDLRLSVRSMIVAPLLYLLGMIVAGTLAANFLVTWVFGVVLFGLVVAAWGARDASRHGIDSAQLWGLAAGFIPFAGITLYMMRREASERGQ